MFDSGPTVMKFDISLAPQVLGRRNYDQVHVMRRNRLEGTR